MSCVFCDDPTQAGDVVFDGEHALVVLHNDWSPRGHVMIIARQHVENPSELDETRWLHLARVWHGVERVLLEITHTDRAMVMKLGIQTPHLHIHLYPVSAEADRAAVFAAIDGKAGVERDQDFVARMRALLTPRRD